MTVEKIREDLKEIRYYYSRKELFDEGTRCVAPNSILEKVRRYNDAVKTAPPKLYDLYISLYVKNNTQEGLAYDMHYTPVYIYLLNKKLLLFDDFGCWDEGEYIGAVGKDTIKRMRKSNGIISGFVI